MNVDPLRQLSQSGPVLIVDQSSESREVLRIILEQRGLRIFEAEEAEEGMCLAERHRPQVIVFNRSEADEGEEVSAADSGVGAELRFHEYSTRHGGQLVILASIRRMANKNSQTTVVAKPYHYGPLVRKIENLVERAVKR